jgi:hypothetical protein
VKIGARNLIYLRARKEAGHTAGHKAGHEAGQEAYCLSCY